MYMADDDSSRHLVLSHGSSSIAELTYSNLVLENDAGSSALHFKSSGYGNNSGYIMFGNESDDATPARSNVHYDGYIKHTGDGKMVFRNGGANNMTMKLNGEIDGNFNDTSDIALKKDISTMSSGLNFIKQLRPVNFKWRKGDKYSSGFIAQEIETVMPENVNGTDYAPSFFTEGGIEINGSQGKSVNTIGLVAYLTKAVQELSAEVDELKNG